MADASPLVALAKQVAGIAERMGVKTAVIGGYALALYDYVRATEDLDLGSDVPITRLRDLDAALSTEGLVTVLRTPDEDDDLGGVIDIRRHEDDEEYVQVVNFRNPYRLGKRHPGQLAVERSELIEEGPLRAVRLAELILMKLHAWSNLGDRQAREDVLALLDRHEIDTAEIERLAEEFELQSAWVTLLASRGS